MMKIVALLAFVGAASAGSLLAAGPAYYQSPALTYAQAPLVKTIAAPAVAYAQAPVYKTVAAPVYKTVAAPVYKTVAAPVYKTVAAPEPYDPNPQYNYGYSVSDALTGDSKSAHETRDGDVVQGQYSLVEPDGSIRTVTYTADAINGFNAVVDRQAPAVVKHVAPVVKTISPVYSTPLLKTVAAAPVYKTLAQPLAYAPTYAKAIY